MAIDITESQDHLQEAREAFGERIAEMAVTTIEVATIFIGTELGYYATLAERGPLTDSEFADATGTHERYAREWLEQQTIAGIIETESDSRQLDTADQRFFLPQAHADLLVNLETDHRMGDMGGMAAALFTTALQAPAVVEAFRTGNGIPFDSYGPACVLGMDAMTVNIEDRIREDWFSAMPDVHARLEADPPARVAEIGCGAGWVAIGLAKQYPNVFVDGFDLDPVSVERARRNADSAGVADRVRFHCQDAIELQGNGDYDLAMSLACIHDLPQPVPVLRSMREMVGEDGAVFIQDPLIEPFHGTAGDFDERLAYAASIVHCLPVGMISQSTVATGCAMQESTLRDYALQAGYRNLEVLPIERDGFLGYYRLIP